MYLQITTHCNMSCPHCVFACSAEKKGDFMTLATLRRAIEHAEYRDAYVTIGGGEPTLHPKFWQFFAEIMASDIEHVFMATNGSVTRTAKTLAHLASTDADSKFSCALSQDWYHDPIDEEVYYLFEKRGLEIRDVGENISDNGSARINNLSTHDRCGCSEIFIAPTGEVRMCGCDDALVLGDLDALNDNALMERAYSYHYEKDCGSLRKMEDWEVQWVLYGTEDGDTNYPSEMPKDLACAA